MVFFWHASTRTLYFQTLAIAAFAATEASRQIRVAVILEWVSVERCRFASLPYPHCSSCSPPAAALLGFAWCGFRRLIRARRGNPFENVQYYINPDYVQKAEGAAAKRCPRMRHLSERSRHSQRPFGSIALQRRQRLAATWTTPTATSQNR